MSDQRVIERLRAEVERLTEWNETLVKARGTLTQEMSKEWAALEARAQSAEQQFETEKDLHILTVGQRDAAEAELAKLRQGNDRLRRIIEKRGIIID